MVTLGLVGAPAAPMTYAAFKALAASGGAVGATLLGAKAAAVGALLGATAAAVGAGLGGYMIGEMILKNLEEPQALPPPGEYFEFGTPDIEIEVQYDFFRGGTKELSDQWAYVGFTPTRGLFNGTTNGVRSFFFLDKNAVRRNILSIDANIPDTNLVIKSFRNFRTTQPVVPTKRLPSYAPNRGNPPLPVPVIVPVPGTPGVPITPRVIPNPANDPDVDDAETPPGIIVQIPETGQQIKFTPDGVTISNYMNPPAREFKVPPPAFPPGGKVATPPCCPSEPPEPPDVDLSEIICRIKTLQDEILNDGFDRVNGETGNSNSGFYEALDGDLYKVQIDITQRPSNLRVQSSTSPAMDVWYVGWFSWVENGFPCKRQYIHFENQTFLAPPGVTGFMYQTYFGCKAVGRWQRRVKKPYVDNC